MKTTLFATLWLVLASAHARDAAPVTFDSCVDWKFSYRKNLCGWRTTSFVIERMLREWFPEIREGQRRENLSPEEMRQFLGALPVASEARVNVVYLASHQSAAAEWYFPHGAMVDWETLLEQSRPPLAPLRIVLVDSCYASSVLRFPSWRRFAAMSVFGAGAAEDAVELDFHSRQPLDLRRRYPAVADWLHDNSPPRWDGKISLLGLVWVKAFLETPKPPVSRAEWVDFFKRCERAADDFRLKTGRKFASTVTLEASE